MQTFRVQIKVNGIQTNEVFKPSRSEAEEWVKSESEKGMFKEGFTHEIEDITAQVEAERVKKETKKADRISRIDKLKAIDWSTVTTIAKCKDILKDVVKELIKDEE